VTLVLWIIGDDKGVARNRGESDAVGNTQYRIVDINFFIEVQNADAGDVKLFQHLYEGDQCRANFVAAAAL
jgi:hypothetical protein